MSNTNVIEEQINKAIRETGMSKQQAAYAVHRAIHETVMDAANKDVAQFLEQYRNDNRLDRLAAAMDTCEAVQMLSVLSDAADKAADELIAWGFAKTREQRGEDAGSVIETLMKAYENEQAKGTVRCRLAEIFFRARFN